MHNKTCQRTTLKITLYNYKYHRKAFLITVKLNYLPISTTAMHFLNS